MDMDTIPILLTYTTQALLILTVLSILTYILLDTFTDTSDTEEPDATEGTTMTERLTAAELERAIDWYTTHSNVLAGPIVPRALAELRELRAENAKLQAALDNINIIITHEECGWSRETSAAINATRNML